MEDNLNNNNVDGLGISGNDNKSPLEQSFPSSSQPAAHSGQVSKKTDDKDVSNNNGSKDQPGFNPVPPAASSPNPVNQSAAASSGMDLPRGVSNSSTSSSGPAPLSKDSNESGNIAPLEPKKGPENNNSPLKELPKNETESASSHSEASPSATPDTDQFLQSILDDNTGHGKEKKMKPQNSNSVDLTKPNPGLADDPDKASHSEPSQKMEPVAPVPEPPAISDKPPIDDHFEPEKNVSTGLDSIKKPVDNTNKKDDMIEATAVKGKKKRRSPLKVILAILLSVIVVGLGYYAYAALFSNNSSNDEYDLDFSYPEDSESLAPLPSGTSGTTSSSALIYDTLDEQRKADLSEIKDALVLYYKDMGSFPDSSEKLILLSSGNTLENALVPEYISEFPYDPSPGSNYGYKSNGSSFTLTAILDDETDPEASTESGKAIYSVTYDPISQTISATPSSVSSEQTSSNGGSTSLPDSTETSSTDREYLLDL